MSSELTPQVAGQLELDSVQFRALLHEVGEKPGAHLESLHEQPSSAIAREIGFLQPVRDAMKPQE